MNLRGKRVLLMGLGLHGGGLGVARWLLRQGALVTITDLKSENELTPSLQPLREMAGQGTRVEFVLGEHRESDFLNADLIIRNPGVPQESRYLALARENGIPIRMEMGLFLEELPRGTDQVIGITGTKGKTTTTMMVGEMLGKENVKTVVAGNLRVSALELLDQIDAETPVVLELSSFQLEEFRDLRKSPRIAAITNISPDHLNRYRSMDDYTAAKAQIFEHQGITDYTILNFDNSILTHLRPRIPGHVVWFSRLRPLNDGAYIDRDSIVWNNHGTKTRLIPISDIAVPGIHNLENSLAASAIAATWGAGPENIADVLHSFRGAPHRLEFVREQGGVTYINDTTATTPTATVAALNALAGKGRGIILIAGGSDKGLDYADMAKAIAKFRPSVVLVRDSATPKIEKALQDASCQDLIIDTFDRFDAAVMKAREEAQPGDIVLLSPGAASFGMFANEFQRGDKFREIVMRVN